MVAGQRVQVPDNLQPNELYFIGYKHAPGRTKPGRFIGVRERVPGMKMYMFKHLEPSILRNNFGNAAIIQYEFGGEWRDIRVFKAVPVAAAPVAAAPAGGAGAPAAAPVPAVAAVAANINEDNNPQGGGRRRKTRNMRKRSRKNTRKVRK